MAPFRWLKTLLTIISSKPALLDGNRDDKATNVGYARVSRQDRNPQMQRGELEAAGCERIFEERISSRKEGRAELKRALEYCREGDVLVVWKLDRLGRSLLKELLGLMGELHNRGVEFRSPRESLDATTPAGKLVFHVFASLAEFERDVIRERTVAGLGAARARGKEGGRKRVMDGRKIALAARLMRDRVSRATLHRYRMCPSPRCAGLWVNPDGTPRG